MPYRKKLPPLGPCPVELFLELVGGKWKVRILGLVSEAPKNFSELQNHLEGVSQPVLSAQVKALVDDGLLIRQDVSHLGRNRVLYSLTPRGINLMPVLNSVADWGNKELSGDTETNHRSL
jgi:DNA-binding HxlR family transcriptional regulator